MRNCPMGQDPAANRDVGIDVGIVQDAVALGQNRGVNDERDEDGE